MASVKLYTPPTEEQCLASQDYYTPRDPACLVYDPSYTPGPTAPPVVGTGELGQTGIDLAVQLDIITWGVVILIVGVALLGWHRWRTRQH